MGSWSEVKALEEQEVRGQDIVWETPTTVAASDFSAHAETAARIFSSP